MNPRFTCISFGCRLNEAEKIVIEKNLLKAGFIHDEVHPDIVVIHSCAVTQKAEREVRQKIYQFKSKHPSTHIIVSGCAATRWLQDNDVIPHVSLYIHNNDKNYIVSRISELIASKTTLIRQNQTQKIVSDKFTKSKRLMIKIQDGCHRYCTYCIVPFLRGAPKSKPIHEIIKEIRSFPDAVSEVILTAINTESYGKDTGEKLVTLIESLLNETTIPRISFGSIHPWSITTELIDFYRSSNSSYRLSSFFHIPIQSGSNSVLRRMNRQYIVETIGNAFRLIKTVNPFACIGTDIIVGFPGETEEEFQETYDFLSTAPIDRFHVFRYSERPGTAAMLLKKRYSSISHEVMKKRSSLLIELSSSKFKQLLSLYRSRDVYALMTQTYHDGHQEGITETGIPILIKNISAAPGAILHASVTGICDTHLVGTSITGR